MYDNEWLSAEKKIDPNFAGSIFEKLGFDAEICPTCGAHLSNGICLNACHLPRSSRQKFDELMLQFMNNPDE